MSRGWRSTKLHLALITMALLTGAYLTTDRSANFSAYSMALLGAAGIYSGAATLEKFRKDDPK